MRASLAAWDRRLGALALVGGLLCSVSMVSVSVGLIAAAGASVGAMAGMSGTGRGAPSSATSAPIEVAVGFLISWGPLILIVSIAAMCLALWRRRKAAAAGALLAGTLLYWGMFGQANLAVMYATMAIGMLAWVSAYIWATGWRFRARPPLR